MLERMRGVLERALVIEKMHVALKSLRNAFDVDAVQNAPTLLGMVSLSKTENAYAPAPPPPPATYPSPAAPPFSVHLICAWAHEIFIEATLATPCFSTLGTGPKSHIGLKGHFGIRNATCSNEERV